MKRSSPSFRLRLLTIALPCTHSRPASITSNLLESIMIGTRLTAGSAAIRLRKRRISSVDSSSPSSMLTSITCAPPSTCSRATATIASPSPARTSRAKAAEPVTFVRSPTLQKPLSAEIATASRPETRSRGTRSGATRGATPRTASAIARMCAGVLPQQPPTMFSSPSDAQAATCSAISAASMS